MQKKKQVENPKKDIILLLMFIKIRFDSIIYNTFTTGDNNKCHESCKAVC